MHRIVTMCVLLRYENGKASEGQVMKGLTYHVRDFCMGSYSLPSDALSWHTNCTLQICGLWVDYTICLLLLDLLYLLGFCL